MPLGADDEPASPSLLRFDQRFRVANLQYGDPGVAIWPSGCSVGWRVRGLYRGPVSRRLSRWV
jgi:hypothetical protein